MAAERRLVDKPGVAVAWGAALGVRAPWESLVIESCYRALKMEVRVGLGARCWAEPRLAPGAMNGLY
ncbi:hypothetical protein BDI4_210030 [Burkholderia diffusa]|nr:hypothetical protein BDI4_210030 [Burkholderia diffusa]